MSEIENEKAILEETPDFDNQLKILEEEHQENIKRRRKYALLGSMLVFIVLVFYVSYSTIYVYREYGIGYFANCQNVNIKVDGSPVPNLNISEGKRCIPKYNVDYYNNRKSTFNIDLFGDRTRIFNAINQMDENGNYCKLNCDRNGDGWPDYNLDLNGDGIADINIIKDLSNNRKNRCDINCDTNFDTIPDYNIDTNGDGTADVNVIESDKLYNIDYLNNRKPMFNIKNSDGSVSNPVIDVRYNPNCDKNCDINGDGFPDYNIVLPDNEVVLNKLNGYNGFINIDIDGNGKPDVNITSDNGTTITNPLNKSVTIDGKKVILNEDKNRDGFPDYNIDIDGDGRPDLNITNGKRKCIQNCDTNYDGKPDTYIKYPDNMITIRNLNIDIDYDGICDVNCDLNYDLIPDINIDIDGDNIPDINIDFDKDGKPDYNLDTNNDGYPDTNIDAYGLGKCNFNCTVDGETTNKVDNSETCTKNCDSDGNGLPDKNVDIDGDGVCDFNCNGDKIDSNNNYILDNIEQKAIVDIEENKEYDFSIVNPLDITAYDIEPGWNGTYILTIKNDSYYTVAYNLKWNSVVNSFTTYNLDYLLTRSNISYLNTTKMPYTAQNVGGELLIRPKTTIKYVMNVSWEETGTNQNVDSGKTFKGYFTAEVIK